MSPPLKYKMVGPYSNPPSDAISIACTSSLVIHIVMLAAHNEGVGCCWVMHFDPAAMREKFNIPSHIEPTALLVMGYPAEDAKPHEFHWKFRPLEETVVYDEF